MSPKQRRERIIKFARAAPEVRRRMIALMTWQNVLEMDADYELWIHESQEEPAGEGWRTWLARSTK